MQKRYDRLVLESDDDGLRDEIRKKEMEVKHLRYISRASGATVARMENSQVKHLRYISRASGATVARMANIHHRSNMMGEDMVIVPV